MYQDMSPGGRGASELKAKKRTAVADVQQMNALLENDVYSVIVLTMFLFHLFVLIYFVRFFLFLTL